MYKLRILLKAAIILAMGGVFPKPLFGQIVALDSLETNACKTFVFNVVDTTKMWEHLDCFVNIMSMTYQDGQNQDLVKKERVESFDTLGINVRKLFSLSQDLALESYLNPYNSLEYEKRYNLNNIAEAGFRINRHQKVGVWSYFSADGQIDSIVNYEDSREIDFCKFFEIASLFGMIGNDTLPDRRSFWEICKAEGFTVKNPNNSINKAGWISLGFIDQRRILSNGKFNSIFSYRKKELGGEWSVIKYLNDGVKRYGFGLSLDIFTREIKYYEVEVIN